MSRVSNEQILSNKYYDLERGCGSAKYQYHFMNKRKKKEQVLH